MSTVNLLGRSRQPVIILLFITLISITSILDVVNTILIKGGIIMFCKNLKILIYFSNFLIIVLFFLFCSTINATQWPLFPIIDTHEITANYGVFAENGFSVVHNGIDIPAPAGTPVYACEAGYVKTITTIPFNEYGWRIFIGEIPGTGECNSWMYAHIDPATFPAFSFDDYVQEGDYLGDVVHNPLAWENHLHLSIVRYHGNWDTWGDGVYSWFYNDNPLDLLPGDNDTINPVIEYARTNSLLAFCNNSGIYFDENEPISGEVDIICRAFDYYNRDTRKSVSYCLEYKIDGDSSIPWTIGLCFNGPLGVWDYGDEYFDVVAKNDQICNSHFDENTQVYYYVLTNNNHDGVVDYRDKDEAWSTPNFTNGLYKIHVRISDKSGNTDQDSMTVSIANFFNIDGNITFNDGITDLSGSVITINSTGQVDTTNVAGDYAVAGAPGGLQMITLSRLGCFDIDTLILINEEKTIDFTNLPIDYRAGDANYDGGVNIGDAVYLMNFVFNNDPTPRPYYAGDANADDNVNIGDVVYLINFIFHEGPPPT